MSETATTNNNELDVEDLKFLERNPRTHDVRNKAMIEDSLRRNGFARSIVLNEKNEILAGNGTTEMATIVGMKKVRVIDTDGDEIIAVRRNNLTLQQQMELALYDNRTGDGELRYDPFVLKDYASMGVPLEDMFTAGELEKIFDGLDVDMAFGADRNGHVTEEGGSEPPTKNSDPLGLGDVDADDDGEATAGIASQVRMVQLFYDGPQHDLFVELIRKIKCALDGENSTMTTSDAVLEILKRADAANLASPDESKL